jgi:DNA invertase Pin-like site-specific DNA recombinase
VTRVIRVLKASRISKSSDDSTSLARQDNIVDALIDSRGWKAIGHAVDDGVSASKVPPFNRPELGPWLTDPVLIASYDVIVWWRLDRAARSMTDLHLLAGWAKEHNKKLIFCEGPGGASLEIDTTSPLGMLLTTVLAFAAEMEAQSIKERVQSSHDYLATQPRWAGGTAPYGYRIVDREGGGKTLDVVPEEAETLRQIVHDIIAGHSLLLVAVQLNEKGVPAPQVSFDYKKGTPEWRTSSLAKMLSSETLMGYKVAKGQVVRDSEGNPLVLADPIIDEATFRQLQVALEKRSALKNRTRNTSPLLGVMRGCGVCGGAVYRQKDRIDKKGVKRRGVYYCFGDPIKDTKGCPGVRVFEDDLMTHIDRLFMEHIGPLDRPEKRFVAGSDHMAELENINCALDNLQAESDAGLIRDQQKYINRLSALTARQKKLAALPAQPDRWEEQPSGKTWGQWWEGASEELRRELLVSAEFQVLLFPGGATRAYWPGKSGLSVEEFLETQKV